MAIPISNTPIGLAGTYPRSLNADIIETCANPGLKFALQSLWESIKDWYFGTHKVEAMNAVYTLATAQTTEAQFKAFATLMACVEPPHRQQLHWYMTDDGGPCFRIREYAFSAAPDWMSLMPMTLEPVEMARLLLSLRHDDEPVLDTLHAKSWAFFRQATERASIVSSDNDEFDMGNLYEAQTQYLRATPTLLTALTLLGMGENAGDANVEYGLRDRVEIEWTSMMASPDVDFDQVENNAANAGHIAKNLLYLVPHALDDIRNTRVPTSPNFVRDPLLRAAFASGSTSAFTSASTHAPTARRT